MRAGTLIGGCVAVLIALAVAAFLATHDRVDGQEWVGPSGEARLRPFLAAERFAERMGLKVSEVRALPELQTLAPRGALLVPNLRQEMHAGKLAELAAWASRGGHLIVEAEALGVPDPLLDQLGVARSQAEPIDKVFTVQPGFTVYLSEGMKLDAPQRDVRLNAAGRLISFAHGRGRVTAAASLRFARNPGWEDHVSEKFLKKPARSIAAHDHAALFWHLLTLTPGAELQVYFRPGRLSLLGFLRDNAAPALAATAALLALWLWSIIPRFGPVAPDPLPGRRRLLDHLRASGRYFWVSGLRSRLVVAARDAALRRVARAQPDFAAAPEAERISRLSTLAGISKEDAARFMAAAGALRGADFIRITQHAQRVHSALEKGRK
jgi:hypothetical protein